MNADTDTAGGPAPQASSDDAGLAPTLAPGTELLGAADEQDGRYLARREDGQVVRMPWELYRVAELLDGTRDLAAVAAEIGVQDDRACSVAEVRLVVERRLVPAGLVLPLPDTDTDSDTDTGVAVAEPPTASGGRTRRRGAVTAVALLLAGLILVAGTAAVTTLLVRPAPAPQSPAVAEAADTGAASPGTAPGGITGPPTLLGRVVEVPDVATAVVDVDGRRLRVDVVGLAPDSTLSCATTDARTFAENTLRDQEVTVVPDPTLEPGPADRWRASLVLDSQLSYSDLALSAGWATAGEGRYRTVYLESQAEAERAGLGQWGPPCRTAS